MLCGLGVPSLRLLWGAVQNRQLYIVRMYCKTFIFFPSIFQFFFNDLHDLPPKKNYMHLPQKKLHNLAIFLYTTYIFHEGDDHRRFMA